MNETNLDSHQISRKKFMLNKKIATAGIFIAVGTFLSAINPFGHFFIFGTKINPFAHVINALTGVLIGLVFSCITALGIAMLRFSTNIGSIHAFHGGITGALVVGTVSYLLRKRFPKYVEFAALFEPLGTVFLGGTIGHLISGNIFVIESLFTFWALFALSSIPGSIIGYIVLMALKPAKISWEDFC
jgi:energy coupling factor transporter S component ThiW